MGTAAEAGTMASDDGGPAGPGKERRTGRLELLGILLIALTAVATAWSAFESSKWGGVMAIRFNEAGAARTESVRQSAVGNRQLDIDVSLFAGYIDASARGDTELATFYRDRFPDRLAPAVDAWETAGPTEGSGDATTPFDRPEYRLEANERADDLERTADRRADQARAANQQSDDYTITSVFFATVILLAALSAKLAQDGLQRWTLTAAWIVFVATAAVVATFPVEI